MNKQQAIDLVKQTFESAFDKSRFSKFIRELLNEANFDASFSHRGQYIYGDFEKDVSLFERIAKYSDGENEIDILIVHLKKDLSIERARTMQRNFIAKYLNSKDRSAALVAFVSPNPEDWRFSLVKMEYGFKERPDGTPKAVTEFTPAKRWSFLVGSHEKSHTAQRQFQPILADSENNPTLEILEEAFNIEKVTKEFFEKYRDLFIRAKGELDQAVAANPKTKADFESKGIDTTNLAKKLLGQIIFLYFLQKKGWFGVPRDAAWGEGSRNFLRELFDKKHSDYKNFFNDILEPLFYEALRIDRSHDDHYYSRFNCKIPFLNGGLFDPMGGYDWVHTDILLPDNLFSNKTKTKEGDEGDGILDAFDRYNFTVKEDEPFEKEVAIDPELLGKAYEKFNAIRPDNYDEFLKALKSGNKSEESKFNRQYGVFYTPREIVHHMCQQSLINYLATELEGKVSRDDIAMLILQGESLLEHEARAASNPSKTYQPILSEAIRKHAALIDEKLANIKVCDPAVGSGAFLVGMMSEIVRAREVLKTWIKTKQTTYDFKRHCIEHSLYGVDIDAGAVEIAKLRLWLSLVVDEDDIQNIKPLPNLDYKVVQGNSLIEILTEDYLAVDSDTERTKFLKQLKKAKDELFNLTSPSQKEQKRREIEDLMQALFENYRDRQIRKLKEQLQGIKGSVRLSGFSDPETLKAEKIKVQVIEGQIKELQNLRLPEKTEHFEWHIIFSEVFDEKHGFDVVIANPPYDVYQGDKEDEIKAIRKTPLYSISEGGKLNAYKLFLAKSAKLQKPNGILCEIFQNSFLADNSATKLRKYFLGNQRIIQLDSFPERDNYKLRVFEDVKMSVCIMLCVNNKQSKYDFNLKTWKDKFMNSSRDILLNNIEILEFDTINATIPSISQQEFSVLKKVSANKRLVSFARCYEGEINLTFHKPYLNIKPNGHARMIKGAAVQRWLIKEKMSQGEIEYLDSVSYLKDNSGKKSQHYKLRRIVMQGITGVDEKIRLKMTILDPKIFCGNSVNYILIADKSLEDEFLLGLLNSHLLNWYFKVFSTNSNVNGYEVDNLPMPNIVNVNQKTLSNIVERILAAKGINPQADTSALEKEIDQLVYQLYGLTDEEIKIIEGQD